MYQGLDPGKCTRTLPQQLLRLPTEMLVKIKIAREIPIQQNTRSPNLSMAQLLGIFIVISFIVNPISAYVAQLASDKGWDDAVRFMSSWPFFPSIAMPSGLDVGDEDFWLHFLLTHLCWITRHDRRSGAIRDPLSGAIIGAMGILTIDTQNIHLHMR